MSVSPFDRGSIPLGAVGLVASWQRVDAAVDRARSRYAMPVVVIARASSADDGFFTPAESVTISGPDALVSLRSAINEALRNEPPRGS